MRFVIDARPLHDAVRTGVGHYTRQMLRHLPRASTADRFVAWGSGPTHDGRGILDGEDAPNLTAHRDQVPEILRPVRSRLGVPRLEWLVKFDGLLATNFVPPPTASRGVALVVHDLAFEVHPETGRHLGERWRARFAEWLLRSAAVIVPSESAKRDLLDRHDLDETRVRVIPHGAEPFEPPSDEDIVRGRTFFGIGGPYALFVGGIEPRKNLPALVEAFERLGDVDAWLVVAGGRTHWTPQTFDQLRERVEALPEGVRRRVKLTGYVSDEQKRALLAGATALVYPSRYEGFGFPVLEGFAAGVPVLTTTASSLPEVAGDAALLVDPEDTDAIADGLRRLFEDPALRGRLVAAGRERVGGFSWARSAAMTAEVLREAATVPSGP